MRIATWNINGLRARKAFVRKWLEAREPDLVGLQECKLADAEFPAAEFAELGYHSIVHGQKGWNGVAVLSREPLEVVQVGLPGQEELGARMLRVRVADLDFTTVYCPNGKDIDHGDFPRKLAWYDALADYFRGEFDAAAAQILCGDFNVCPEPIDSWRGSAADGDVFHTEEERARFRALTALGFVDLFRHLYPDATAHSWWDYRGGAFHRRQGLRIDFILGSPALLGRVQDVTIDRDFRRKKDGLTASDHAPVFVDLAPETPADDPA